MADRKVGDLIDALGVVADVDDGDLVPCAVVLLKSVDEDGQVGLTIASSEGLSWLDQLGIVEAAKQIITSGDYLSRGD